MKIWRVHKIAIANLLHYSENYGEWWRELQVSGIASYTLLETLVRMGWLDKRTEGTASKLRNHYRISTAGKEWVVKNNLRHDHRAPITSGKGGIRR